MVNALDAAVGKIVDSLKRLNYYNNTVIIFGTDNGGQTRAGGNNFPLRGNKGTLWEGGTRAVSFVHSPRHFADFQVRASLFHIVDWYATLLSLAGYDNYGYGDGLNQMSMIFNGTRGLRNDLVYNIDDRGAAFRIGRYKLITGDPGSPSGWIPPRKRGFHHFWRRGRKPMLFDIIGDPTEHHDISHEKPKLTSEMLKDLRVLKRTMVPNLHKNPVKRGSPDRFNDDLTVATLVC